MSTAGRRTRCRSDYCTGEILGWDGATQTLLRAAGFSISSFGEDEQGELYVLGLSGTLYRLTNGPTLGGSYPRALVFTPLTPCRLGDTRNAVGPFAAFESRSYAASDATRIAQAGGNAAGCSIPVGPSALALTLTAVAPPQQGNIVAFQAGVSPPLASVLNFLPGQVVANTTIVAATPRAGDNFTIANNTNGTADLVIDTVGYFWEYGASDCNKASQTQSVGAAASSDVAASCAIGYRAVGGGCSASTPGAISWLDRGSLAAGAGYHCGVKNSAASPVSVTTDAMCCRLGGR